MLPSSAPTFLLPIAFRLVDLVPLAAARLDVLVISAARVSAGGAPAHAPPAVRLLRRPAGRASGGCHGKEQKFAGVWPPQACAKL